ncbi:hypothetical protein Vretimale_11567, partial [Volvox reticuliferus]
LRKASCVALGRLRILQEPREVEPDPRHHQFIRRLHKRPERGGILPPNVTPCTSTRPLLQWSLLLSDAFKPISAFAIPPLDLGSAAGGRDRDCGPGRHLV